MRRTATCAALVALFLGRGEWLAAQAPAAFEVVSIKRSHSDVPGSRVGVEPNGRFIITNVPVSAVILVAFELQDSFQVDGLPEWARKDLFDIEAEAPQGMSIAFPGQGTALPGMLRSMLADRMKLVSHMERRVVPMFALVTARSDGRLGPGLTRSDLDCTTASPRPAKDERDGTASAAETSGCGNHATLDSFSGRGLPLDRVIRLIIAPRVGRPVVDRTGLSGRFDIALQFQPPDRPNAGAAAPLSTPTNTPDLPRLETALQQQLGLKLQPVREAADVLVIDHVEPPSED